MNISKSFATALTTLFLGVSSASASFAAAKNPSTSDFAASQFFFFPGQFVGDKQCFPKVDTPSPLPQNLLLS